MRGIRHDLLGDCGYGVKIRLPPTSLADLIWLSESRLGGEVGIGAVQPGAEGDGLIRRGSRAGARDRVEADWSGRAGTAEDCLHVVWANATELIRRASRRLLHPLIPYQVFPRRVHRADSVWPGSTWRVP
jgi:hypothetical protein